MKRIHHDKELFLPMSVWNNERCGSCKSIISKDGVTLLTSSKDIWFVDNESKWDYTEQELIEMNLKEIVAFIKKDEEWQLV